MRSNVLHERFLQNGTANKGVRSPTFLCQYSVLRYNYLTNSHLKLLLSLRIADYFHIVYHI